MNRAQTERAAVLYQELDQHDAYLAGLMKPKSVDVVVKIGDGEASRELVFALPMSAKLEGDPGVKAYVALIETMRKRRDGIAEEIRQLGGRL